MADPDEILLDAADRMDSAIQALKRELSGLRSGRAQPSLVEGLEVEYYGAVTPLKQLGTINAPEARLITVQVWDRGAVQAIVKAIQASDLGLNPQIDGQLLRLPIPALTEQRRRDLVKIVHSRAEESRVAIRNVRRHVHDELRKIEKDHLISQDDLKRHEDDLQKLTDQHVSLVDAEAKRKEAELLEV
ncbi:MAG TPA: ribosome recycling factor [Tepidiformaceae bacterium]|nr:ribosome recycling factor [Tepidiformaceae bacterium]